MAETPSKTPFTIIDDANIEQKIVVIPVDVSGETQIVGYAYTELTGSSYQALADISSSLSSISTPFVGISDSVTSISNSVGDISSSLAGISGSFVEVSGAIASISSSSGDISSSVASISSSAADISSSVSGISSSFLEVSGAIASISGSASDISSSNSVIATSTGEILTYVKQDVRFNRATHVYSAVFDSSSIFDDRGGLVAVYLEPALNPLYEDLSQTEQQITKAIDVIIQNATNKTAYVKVSYDPTAIASDTDYTVRIPPGVIYNSEQKLAHMRHKIYYKPLTGFEGEAAVTVVYNNNLNDSLSTGNDPIGTTELSTLATNVYDIPFNPPQGSVINEWSFNGSAIYNLLKITGQARVNSPGQELGIWITTKDNETHLNEISISETVPTQFTLEIPNPADGTYELIASGSGLGDIGDARILFADLIKTNTTPPP